AFLDEPGLDLGRDLREVRGGGDRGRLDQARLVPRAARRIERADLAERLRAQHAAQVPLARIHPHELPREDLRAGLELEPDVMIGGPRLELVVGREARLVARRQCAAKLATVADRGVVQRERDDVLAHLAAQADRAAARAQQLLAAAVEAHEVILRARDDTGDVLAFDRVLDHAAFAPVALTPLVAGAVARA